ncbi:MAG: hypothetical protein V8R46_06095 [Eubacterium ramulus]
MEQLQKFYGDILDLYGPYPVHGKERANQDKPMLIITTVRMKDFRRLFHAPMLTVSPLLDEEDQARLEHCLTDIKCKLLYPEKKRAIQDYIRPDMIYKMKNKDSLSSVIAAIQDRFYVKKYMVEKVAVDLENDSSGDFTKWICVYVSGRCLYYRYSSQSGKTGACDFLETCP